MISLFLVEDEIVARESIRKNINWIESGILFLGEAADGEVALPRILESKPDILLTDIKMPFMDGLELSRLVKAKLPSIRIIILSGHDEFEYARQAISIGVNEYILKPVSSAKILQSVKKVRVEIEAERSQRSELSERLCERTTAARLLFLNGLLNGYLSGTGPIIERAGELNISLCARLYKVVVLHTALACMRTPLQLPSDWIREKDSFIAFERTDEEMVFLLQHDDEDTLEKLETKLADWVSGVMAEQEVPYIMSSGCVVNRITDIAKSYKAARELPSADISRHGSPIVGDARLSPSMVLEREEVLSFLRTGRQSDISSFWQNYSKSVETGMKSMMYRCYVYTELLFVFGKFAEEMNIEAPDILSKTQEMERLVLENESPESLVQFAGEISRHLITLRDTEGTVKANSIETRAKEYIDRNYADEDISLNSVAAFVNVTPSYFSTVFKEKTGRNFSEYLTEKRILEAKTLLKCTDLRASEISWRVGYKNANYFSMIFKKVTGQAPSEYRSEV